MLASGMLGLMLCSTYLRPLRFYDGGTNATAHFNFYFSSLSSADLDTYKLTMQSVADEVTASAKREKLIAASLESLNVDMQLLRSQLEGSQREVAESRSACQALERQIADKEASDLNEQASHQKSSEAAQSQLRLTLEQLEMVRAERKTLRIELDSLQSAMQVSSAQAVKVQGEADSARAESRRREKELTDASAQVFDSAARRLVSTLLRTDLVALFFACCSAIETALKLSVFAPNLSCRGPRPTRCATQCKNWRIISVASKAPRQRGTVCWQCSRKLTVMPHRLRLILLVRVRVRVRVFQCCLVFGEEKLGRHACSAHRSRIPYVSIMSHRIQLL